MSERAQGLEERASQVLGDIEEVVKKMDSLRIMLHETPDDTEVLARLRTVLTQHPKAWRLAGDLARDAAYTMILTVAEKDVIQTESILEGMEKVRAGLGYSDSSALERLLIDQIVLCWLNWEVTLYLYTCIAFDGKMESALEPYWGRRLDQAERRYQRAIESLARTRKLIRSTKTVQINVAQQQVVANTAVTGKLFSFDDQATDESSDQ